MYVDNIMTIAALTIQGSISKLNLVCIAMLSSDPHSLSMHQGVEAMIIGTIVTGSPTPLGRANKFTVYHHRLFDFACERAVIIQISN